MRENPLISVIVPVYNVELYLRRCLDSVLAQTFTDFEVVCVDDASTDSSFSVLCEYEARDARISVLRNEQNSGLSYTRNVGLRHAKGKYVYFLDSDDAIVPKCLELLYTAADRDDADIVIFCAVEKEAGKKDIVYSFPLELCGKVFTGRDAFVRMKRTAGVLAPVQFKLWKHSFLSQFELHFYEGIYHEDELFFFAALMVARRVICIQDVLYLYYHTPGSIMRRRWEFKHIEGLIVVIREIQKIWKNGHFSAEVNDAILNHLAGFYLEAARRMFSYGIGKLPKTSPLFDVDGQVLYTFIRHIAVKQYCTSLNEEQFDVLRSFEHILVYGAGKIAMKLLPELLQNGIQNIEVVVSSADGNPATLYGFPVREIGHVTYQKEHCAVIIAVGQRLDSEVRQNLCALGWNHIVSLTTMTRGGVRKYSVIYFACTASQSGAGADYVASYREAA